MEKYRAFEDPSNGINPFTVKNPNFKVKII